MSHIEDRWFRTIAGPDGKPVKEPRTRNGAGRRWRVRYEDPDGNERSRSFDKKAEADNFRTEIDAALKRGTYHDPDAGRITLGKYAGEWLEAQTFDAVTREAVESRMRLHVLPGLGSRRLDELAARPSLIAAWIAGLQHLSPSTTAKVLTHLNSVMRAAVQDARITSNPCSGMARKIPQGTQRRLEPWTPEQAARVRGALPPRLAAVIDAGKGLGLRQSEIFGLSVDEIDFLRRTVHLRQQVKLVGGRACFAPPKGKKERDVPLAGPTADALAAHLAQFPAVEVTLPWHEPRDRRHGRMVTVPLLFTSKAGRALQRHGFNTHVWRPALVAAGLEVDRVNGCHMMRHLYVSTLISAGVDVRTVAENLGHNDGGALVLKTYSHLMPDSEDKTRRALEAAFAADADFPATGPLTAQEGGPRP